MLMLYESQGLNRNQNEHNFIDNNEPKDKLIRKTERRIVID
jgi:hypothetical protein